ncbi:MAG TPA: hypothetical protein DCP28_21040 [Cytophagales bacterium]|nr:hypothetical protein [Cytophagales bacterium]
MASEKSIPNPLEALGAELLAEAGSLLGSEDAVALDATEALPQVSVPDELMESVWFWESSVTLHALPTSLEATAESLHEEAPEQKIQPPKKAPQPYLTEPDLSSLPPTATTEVNFENNDGRATPKAEVTVQLPETSADQGALNDRVPSSLLQPPPKKLRIGSWKDFAQAVPTASSAKNKPLEEKPSTTTGLQEEPQEKHTIAPQSPEFQAHHPKTSSKLGQKAQKETGPESPEQDQKELKYPVRGKTPLSSLSQWARQAQEQVQGRITESSLTSHKQGLPSSEQSKKTDLGKPHPPAPAAYPKASNPEASNTEDLWATSETEEDGPLEGTLQEVQPPVTGQSAIWNSHLNLEADTDELVVPSEVAEDTESLSALGWADPETWDPNYQETAAWPTATAKERRNQEWSTKAMAASTGQAESEAVPEPEIPEIRRTAPMANRSRRTGLKAWQDLRLDYRRRTGK